jgi:hypothetical protein
MNHLTPSDLVAIKDLFIFTFIFGLSLSFFIYHFLYGIYKKLARSINYPDRIKTEDGYLYRSIKRTYVSKQRAEELFFQNKLKRRKSYIAFHTRMLQRLQSSEPERVSTSDPQN